MANNLILAVNGTLMRGLKLENNLKEVGAIFLEETTTSRDYRLFSINDEYPAMLLFKLGAPIAVELYEISEEGFKQVLDKEPPGLTVEDIYLADGRKVKGVVGTPEIIKGQKDITSYGGWRNYMKELHNKLFIYYSYTGNGEVVATKMQEKGYEIRKIETVKKMPKSFFLGMMKGGFEAGVKKKAKLKGLNQDIAQYDEIVIGSPIWNGRITPAINTVLSLLDLKDKKLTFVFYAGSGEGKKALKRVNKEYPSANVVFLKQPKDHLEELEKLNNL